MSVCVQRSHYNMILLQHDQSHDLTFSTLALNNNEHNGTIKIT